ncbi:vitamin K-dependent gamma-carboxylase-like, partial [Oppia nitens]|uniref:vitamin K-dependent gamma-carboxylase-like n=1 Tax=Oppia nitens TaxID=1686743 RepID=UPI0023D9C303
MFTKCDASSLAYIRIVVGILLLIDLVYERGLSRAELIWGNPNECRFPLFDGLKVLPLRAMFAVYTLMFIGVVGIILGYKYKMSCFIYIINYWYLFLLDKSRWNNHSYLFGLLVTLLSICDANCQWSLDRFLNKQMDNRVAFWQYFLIKSQIFFVYFMAGIKKFDTDWLNGYSMNYLSEHWVFRPFRLILSNESIDYYVIHLGGFLFDLTIGFFLICSYTQSIAYIFCLIFNLMNSRLFSIGMFPYMMIAVMPVFSAYDWPKNMIQLICNKKSNKIESNCKSIKRYNSDKQNKFSSKHRLTFVFVIIYIISQLLLPNSHWITKGYNTWTNGLYGYSWDMMVHNWKHIHTTITVVDKSMNKFYLNPQSWTQSMRWSHHSDMVKQYVMCAHKRLVNEFNITDPSIFVDTWISLNGRFAQRVYDPRVDLVKAEWTPFKRPDWVLPILSYLADWRQKLKQYEYELYKDNNQTAVIFMADFPGMTLNYYMGSEFNNTSLVVLKGWLKHQIVGQSTRIMSTGDQMVLPVNCYHKLTPIKSETSAYMFIYVNSSLSFINHITSQSHNQNHSTKNTNNESENISHNPWFQSLQNMWSGIT